MKFAMMEIMSAALLCCAVSAQQAAPAQSEPASTASPQTDKSGSLANANSRFAPGTVIPVELTKAVDAKKAKSGDGVEAKVTQDLKAGNGQVMIPKDTKVVGHVTEALARTKDQKESQLGLVFDHAVIKGGNEVTLPLSIQAIIGPDALGNGPQNGANASPSSQTTEPAPSGGMPSNSSGRTSGMGNGSASTVSPPPTGGEAPATNQTQQASHEPITASTQGVVAIPNLRLSATPDSKAGSVVTSEKNNVKLESGTFMLLRVNQ